jgi:hypothetical protein
VPTHDHQGPWRPAKPRPRYLGSWGLPSGNSADVYLAPDGQLACYWDTPPSPSWPDEDLAHWKTVSFPEICRAVQAVTGLRVLGVSL